MTELPRQRMAKVASVSVSCIIPPQNNLDWPSDVPEKE